MASGAPGRSMAAILSPKNMGVGHSNMMLPNLAQKSSLEILLSPKAISKPLLKPIALVGKSQAA